MEWILGIVILAADVFTKYLVEIYLQPRGSIQIIKNVFHLTYVQNRGIAFGIMQNKSWFFVPITLLIICIMIYILFTMRQSSLLMRISLMLILSGALGNLKDRLMKGYVVDFFDFRVWPVFNIADSAIVIGAVLLAYVMLVMGGST